MEKANPNETELKALNDARAILLHALWEISGYGPDWRKASNALQHINAQRDPILAAMLAPEPETGLCPCGAYEEGGYEACAGLERAS